MDERLLRRNGRLGLSGNHQAVHHGMPREVAARRRCASLPRDRGGTSRLSIKVGEGAEIVGMKEKSRTAIVTGLEMFHQTLEQGGVTSAVSS